MSDFEIDLGNGKSIVVDAPDAQAAAKSARMYLAREKGTADAGRSKSDSVAQARNFNSSFGPGRGLDGFVISKCDTVGDMVGTLVSMVHATGIPVVFLGVGQHYADLRGLNVGSVCRLLMS